jgi:hypothetical protein
MNVVDVARMGVKRGRGREKETRTSRPGVSNLKNRRRLTQKLILGWADAHFERMGAWPVQRSGPIAEAPGETWLGVEMALRQRIRGFKRRSTLYQLLRKHREIE